MNENQSNALLIIAVFAAVLLLAPFGIYGMMRTIRGSQGPRRPSARDEYEARFTRARLARADVLSMSQTSVREGTGTAVVRLWLQVYEPGGHTYQTASSWEVELASLNHLQPGQPVAVKIDTADGQRVYPNVSWATYCWWQ